MYWKVQTTTFKYLQTPQTKVGVVFWIRFRKRVQINILETHAAFVALKQFKIRARISVHSWTPSDSWHQPLSGDGQCNVENYDLMQPIQNLTLFHTRPRVPKCNCRFFVQIGINSLPICHRSKQVPLYVSSVQDLQAWGTDAMNSNWSGLTAYAYPPTALLFKVMQRIQ